MRLLRSIAVLTAATLVRGFCAAQELIDVRPLGVEGDAADFAPVIVDSAFVMCSLRERPADGVVEYTDAETGERLSDLYRVRFIEGRPGKAFLLGEALTSEMNDGPATFTDHGDAICFTRNQTRLKKLGNTRAKNDALGLYFSHRDKGDWSEPEPFEYNSPEHNVMHAAYSADGRTLIFASDMPGGLGGTDLYRCDLENGGWSLPLNLGPSVNSEANELFPFLQANGKLYFSSGREGGMGKLDLYACDPMANGWKAAIALPPPFNSEGNDLGYTAWPTDRAGLFSSDREGLDRIYRFNRTIAPFTDCAEQQENNYCYQFSEEAGVKPDGLPLRYEWDLGDGHKANGLEARHCYKGPGRYSVKLNLVDTLNNGVFFNQATYELVLDDIHQPYINAIDSARAGRPVALDAYASYLPDWPVEELRWDLGDGTIEEGRKLLHTWREPGDYTVKLDAIGTPDSTGRVPHHCVTRSIHVIQRFKDVADDAVYTMYKDARGNAHEFTYQSLPHDAFNMDLTDAEDVSFTVELFASKERLSLNDPRFMEVRKLFPVYERFDPVRGVYTYSVGEAKTLSEMYEVYKKVKELHFLDAEVMAIEPEKLTDMSALASLSLEELNNTTVRTSTVNFDFDKASIKKGSEEALEQVKSLLYEHADLDVVIEAHTDSKGKGDYNMKLAQRRAQAIVDWLIAHGVEASRMTAVGFGEDHPIASNDHEIGRGQNRRVEFRMVMRADQANARRR